MNKTATIFQKHIDSKQVIIKKQYADQTARLKSDLYREKFNFFHKFYLNEKLYDRCSIKLKC